MYGNKVLIDWGEHVDIDSDVFIVRQVVLLIFAF